MELSERCIAQLEKEGWRHVYEWSDAPGTAYPAHTHTDKVVFFVTEGSFSVEIQGQTHQLRTGDRFDVPPQTPYTMVIGSEGCQYVVGEMGDDSAR
jgi:mannose-6-phosphate isomerase-like protein (cupin superfamily)